MVKQNKKNDVVGVAFPRYSGMIIAASLASSISSFVDGIITGKMLGSEAMAAFGLALPFVLILAVVSGMILSSGGSICSAKAMGAGNQNEANENFTACLILGFSIGIAAALICLFFSKPLILTTGAQGALATEAASYLRGYALGTIPTILLTILMNYANLDGNENLAFIAVVAMTVADVLLDLLLGVKLELGLLGMALATSASYLLSIIVFLLGYLKGKSSFSLRFRNVKTEIRKILKTGYPAALNTLLVSTRCFFLNSILMSVAGSDAVSAFSFQSNFNQIFLAVATGVSTAVRSLSGIFIGEKDREKIKTVLRRGFTNGISISVALAVVLVAGSNLMTDLMMSGSERCMEYASAALRLYGLSMPASIVCIILISYYQTTGDRKTANTIAVGHGLVFPLACAYLLSKLFGLNGAWISTLIAECLMLVALAIILKIRTGKMPKTLEELAVIDESAFPEEDAVFRCSETTRAIASDDMRNAFDKFLVKNGLDSEMRKEILDTFFDIVRSGASQKGFADVQAAFYNEQFAINVRFNGRNIDRLLNSSEWNDKKKEPSPQIEIDSHYSAGISFVSIHWSLH